MVIRKSQQVNLDPEPWVNPKTGTRYPAEGGLLRDYLPRPEFEPTRDPEPWRDLLGYRFTSRRAAGSAGASCYWAPRREQFDNPVNQALVDFRNRFNLNSTSEDAAEWLEVGIDPWHYTPEDLDHAQRVLTRLANWRN